MEGWMVFIYIKAEVTVSTDISAPWFEVKGVKLLLNRIISNTRCCGNNSPLQHMIKKAAVFIAVFFPALPSLFLEGWISRFLTPQPEIVFSLTSGVISLGVTLEPEGTRGYHTPFIWTPFAKKVIRCAILSSLVISLSMHETDDLQHVKSVIYTAIYPS